MTTNEIGYVIDTLSNKIGLAAEKITPIAQTMVDQYMRANAFGLGIGIFIFLSGLIVSIFTFRKDLNSYTDDQNARYIIGRVAGIIGMVVGVILSLVFGYKMMTPMTSLLGL